VPIRRDKILLEYWSRLKGCGYENPAKNVTQECWEYATYESDRVIPVRPG
jgi:hypothetical protein